MLSKGISHIAGYRQHLAPCVVGIENLRHEVAVLVNAVKTYYVALRVIGVIVDRTVGHGYRYPSAVGVVVEPKYIVAGLLSKNICAVEVEICLDPVYCLSGSDAFVVVPERQIGPVGQLHALKLPAPRPLERRAVVVLRRVAYAVVIYPAVFVEGQQVLPLSIVVVRYIF